VFVILPALQYNAEQRRHDDPARIIFLPIVVARGNKQHSSHRIVHPTHSRPVSLRIAFNVRTVRR
jgi:hypothetical protein